MTRDIDVLAELVDAERVRGARPERDAEGVGQVEVLEYGPGRPRISTISGAATAITISDDDDAAGDDRDAVLAEAAPEQLQRRARGDRRRRRRGSSSVPAAGTCLSRASKLIPRGTPHWRCAAILTCSSTSAPNLHLRRSRSATFRRCSAGGRHARCSDILTRVDTLFGDEAHPAAERTRCPTDRSPPAAASAATAAGGAHAPAHPRRVRRAVAPARRGLGAAHGDRAGPPALDGPLRAARLGQDDARADRRRALRRGLRGAERGAGRPRRGARGDRARAAPRATTGGARRPSCSSTRSTASTRPSRTRCCRRSRRAS